MRLSAMVKKEFRQIIRDPVTLFLIIIMPGLLVLLFGYALSFDVRHIKTGICDQDGTEHSRAFVRAMTAGEYFDLLAHYQDQREIERGLDTGQVTVAVLIPQGFGQKIDAGEQAEIQGLIDGTNAQMATIVQGYLKGFAQVFSLNVMSKTLMRAGYKTLELPVTLEPRVWYNPELNSTVFLIPGLIVFILMISSAISTAISVVRERERGTMEQLLVSPLRSFDVILGKTIPYFFIAMTSAIVILAVGDLVFDVHVKGIYTWLFISLTLFIVAALGQGILISTITDSQQLAFQYASFTTMLPSLLLSGFIFPIKNMALPLQLISYIIPARYFISVLRALLLKGVGVETFAVELGMLLLIAVCMLSLAMFRLARAKLV